MFDCLESLRHSWQRRRACRDTQSVCEREIQERNRKVKKEIEGKVGGPSFLPLCSRSFRREMSYTNHRTKRLLCQNHIAGIEIGNPESFHKLAADLKERREVKEIGNGRGKEGKNTKGEWTSSKKFILHTFPFLLCLSSLWSMYSQRPSYSFANCRNGNAE